jgi:hypothetical protein
MITADDIRETLARCAAYDAAHFPKPSAAMADMWFDHFSQFEHLTKEDLTAAVRKYYNIPSQPVPQPADISKIARGLAIDRYERSSPDSPERLAYEAVCDAKAGAGTGWVMNPLPGPEVSEIKLERRRRAIESYARTFGISAAEAATRMAPAWEERNELDSVAVAAAHRRHAGPPQAIPCPDCGATEPCEHDAEQKDQGPHEVA